MVLNHSQVKLTTAAVVKVRRLVWNLMLKQAQVMVTMRLMEVKRNQKVTRLPMEVKKQALTVTHTAAARIFTAQIVMRLSQMTGLLILTVTRAHAAAVKQFL